MRNSDHQSDHIYYTYFYECTQIVLDVCDLQMTPSVFVVYKAFCCQAKADLQVAWSVPLSKQVSYLEWIPYLWLMFNTKQFANGLAKKKNLLYWYLSNLLKTKHPTCWQLFIVPTIVLPLLNRQYLVYFAYLFLN
jgi:hypothetical protein